MIPQNVYDAASAAYALSVERGDALAVRNAVDAAYELIRQNDLEEFLDGSGLEYRIRLDQVRIIRKLITAITVEHEGTDAWNQGYQEAISQVLELLGA
jgi:hypothetical protein